MTSKVSECIALRPLAALLLACAALALPGRVLAGSALLAPELSEAELLDLVRHAPPAPEPPLDDPGVHLEDELARRSAWALTTYGRGLGVVAPDPAAGGLPLAELALSGEEAARLAGLAPAALESTVPTPVYDTMQPPWNAVAKLLIRFVVDGKPHFYGCSGVLIGPFHLATAAHCIFSWDPDGDGRMDDANWADDVWVWPGQTDMLEPFSIPERPFGESRSVLNRAYQGWTLGRDRTWDIALLTLNRQAADPIAWMGVEIDHPVAGLGFSGYPAEQPYVPPNTLVQYAGFGTDNVVKYGERQVMLAIYSYGGQSGGPVWRSDGFGDAAMLQGVLSVSDRQGYAAATLVTEQTLIDFATWMSDDHAERMPTPRPDLCEYMLVPAAKALLTDSARQGETIRLTFNVYNSGTADSGTVAVDFYLSDNPAISTQDRFVARRELDSLAGSAALVADTELRIPAAIPPGEYYVGWKMQAAEPEYATNNNAVIIGDQMLRIDRASTPSPTPTSTPEPTATATASPAPTETPTAVPACLGDCGGDRRVTVDELVVMVTIGLGMVSVDACPSGDADHDGQVSIAEVIASVRHALDGCADGRAG